MIGFCWKFPAESRSEKIANICQISYAHDYSGMLFYSHCMSILQFCDEDTQNAYTVLHVIDETTILCSVTRTENASVVTGLLTILILRIMSTVQCCLWQNS